MNSQSFDLNKTNGRKQLLQLLGVLLDYNEDPENDSFNDIHIRQEEGFAVLEWDTVPYSGEWGGRWRFVADDEVVMKETSFPDGHYEYLFPDEVDGTLEEWLKKHPEWVKTQYGMWTNVEENRRSSIDWNIDEWLDKGVDFEFKYQSVPPHGLTVSEHNSDVILSLVECLKKDRLIHRTDYIVVGSKNINLFTINDLLKPQKEFDGNKVLSKIGVLSLKLDKQRFSDDEEDEYYDDDIHVYYSDKAGDRVLLLTDGSYRLYTVRMTDVGGEG